MAGNTGGVDPQGDEENGETGENVSETGSIADSSPR